MKIYCRSESRKSIAQRAAEAVLPLSEESVSKFLDICVDYVPDIDVVRLEDVVNSIIVSKYVNYFRKASNDDYGAPPETYEDMVDYATRFKLVWVSKVAIHDGNIIVDIGTQFIDYVMSSYYYVCIDGNVVNEKASYKDFKTMSREGFSSYIN